MLKSLVWIAVGAAGALELDRLLDRQKERWRPQAVTGKLLDKANERLEKGRSGS
jgi:hypothetical protein